MEKGTSKLFDRNAEQRVLGSMLFDEKCANKMLEMLSDNDFYVNEHKTIFKAIKNLRINKKPIDALLLVYSLRETNLLDACGGEVYIFEITNKATIEAMRFAYDVKERSTLRHLLKVTPEVDSIKLTYKESQEYNDDRMMQIIDGFFRVKGESEYLSDKNKLTHLNNYIKSIIDDFVREHQLGRHHEYCKIINNNKYGPYTKEGVQRLRLSDSDFDESVKLKSV